MKFEFWLTFVAAYTIISLIPGPSVLLVIAQALTRGRKAAFLCILGDIVGGFFLIALALFGVGAVLATSATLFLAVKWAGVFYMAWLGWNQIRDARRGNLPISHGLENDPFAKKADLASARAGFFVGILNPKAIMFYVAFLSQFLDPAANIVGQFGILVVTSTIIVGSVLGIYALLADRARMIFQIPQMQRRAGYVGGGFLLGGSVMIAATR